MEQELPSPARCAAQAHSRNVDPVEARLPLCLQLAHAVQHAALHVCHRRLEAAGR